MPVLDFLRLLKGWREGEKLAWLDVLVRSPSHEYSRNVLSYSHDHHIVAVNYLIIIFIP